MKKLEFVVNKFDKTFKVEVSEPYVIVETNVFMNNKTNGKNNVLSSRKIRHMSKCVKDDVFKVNIGMWLSIRKCMNEVYGLEKHSAKNSIKTIENMYKNTKKIIDNRINKII